MVYKLFISVLYPVYLVIWGEVERSVVWNEYRAKGCVAGGDDPTAKRQNAIDQYLMTFPPEDLYQEHFFAHLRDGISLVIP